MSAMEIESSSTNEGVPDLRISWRSIEFEFPALNDGLLPVSPKFIGAKLEENNPALAGFLHDVPCTEQASTPSWYVNVDADLDTSSPYDGTSSRSCLLPYFTEEDEGNLSSYDEAEVGDSEADQPSVAVPTVSRLCSPCRSSSSASSCRSSTKIFNVSSSLDARGISHRLLVKLRTILKKASHGHDCQIHGQGLPQQADYRKIHKRDRRFITAQAADHHFAYQSHHGHKDGKQIKGEINCERQMIISRFRAPASVVTQSNVSSPYAEHYAQLRTRMEPLRRRTSLPYRYSLLFGKSLFPIAQPHALLSH
ncbi:hypothetical protein KP509_09G098300 [Ceratopteris richardii]|uniref:Uncharacterized protein n=1 Tax=Ceratopteris richardii TaxID=49495 RepID=A0A8T2UD90_CERRI|nr:hypothetical protein KP509_09G098300 [Ceratopteris richardii]